MPVNGNHKSKPADTSKHSTNELPDENDTKDTAFLDCSSENGSLNKQVRNDTDCTLDSNHDSNCISKISSDITTSDSSSENDSTSDSNYSSLNHPRSHDSDVTSLDSSSENNSISDFTSNNDTTASYSSLHNHGGCNSHCISKTTLSDVTSFHHASESNDVSKKVSRHHVTDYERKMKSSFIGNSFAGEKECPSHLHELAKVTNYVQSDEMKRFTIPSHKNTNKECVGIETIKQGLPTHISKCSQHNTPHTYGTKSGSLNVEELLAKFPVKYAVKELVAELIKLAAISNVADSIATVQDYCLKYLEGKLDDISANVVKILPEVILSTVSTMLDTQINDFKVKAMDDTQISDLKVMDDSHLVRFEAVVVSDSNYHQSDNDWYLRYVYGNFMSDTEKKYSALKNAKEGIKDYLHSHNPAVDRQNIIVMFSTCEDPNGECIDSIIIMYIINTNLSCICTFPKC